MLFSGFMLGFFGSLHCVGMCGPLWVAVNKKFPGYQFMPWQVWYHFGRILTYSLLGILLGTLGLAIGLAGIQSVVSIGLGLVVFLYFLLPGVKNRVGLFSKNMYLLPGKFREWFSKAFHYSYNLSAFLSGLLNGLLPCGLVYLGLSGALTLDTPWEGQLYMFAFGIGTLPGLVVLPPLLNKLGKRLPSILPLATRVIGILFGLYLIYRGLGLGYPGSPELIYDKVVDTIITVCGLD